MRSLPPKGGISEDDFEAVFILNVVDVFREGIGVEDVGGFDAVKDHVHDGDDIGEGFLLFAEEGAFLEGFEVFGGEPGRAIFRSGEFLTANREIGVPGCGVPGFQVLEGFAKEAGGAASAIVDAVADARLDDLNDGANERARRVVFAAVASGVAHVADFGFIEMGELVLFGLRAKAQLVDVVNDFAEVVAALNLVFGFAEDLADFVFDSVGAGGALLKAVEIGKELAADEVAQVVAGESFVVVDLAVFGSWSCPGFPAISLFKERRVFLAAKLGFGGAIVFESVEIFEEEEPGGLLGVVELGGAARFSTESFVDVLENLLKH